jgi:hypothetical protein
VLLNATLSEHGAVFKQSDAFNKAAECERLMNLETDEIQRSAYRSLTEMWINLANEYASMTSENFAREFDDLDQIQTRFTTARKPSSPRGVIRYVSPAALQSRRSAINLPRSFGGRGHWCGLRERPDKTMA